MNPPALVLTESQFTAFPAAPTAVGKIAQLPVGAAVIVLSDARDELVARLVKETAGDDVDTLVFETSGIAPPDADEGTIPVVVGSSSPRRYEFQYRVLDQYAPDPGATADNAGQLYRQLPMGDLSARQAGVTDYRQTFLATYTFPIGTSQGFVSDDGLGSVSFTSGRITLECPAATDSYTDPLDRPRVLAALGQVASWNGEADIVVPMQPILGTTDTMRAAVTLSNDPNDPEGDFALVLEVDAQATAEARARIVTGGVSATLRDWAPVAGLATAFADGFWSLRIQRTGNQILFWIGEDTAQVGNVGTTWSLFAETSLLADDVIQANPYLYVSAGEEGTTGPLAAINVYRIVRLR